MQDAADIEPLRVQDVVISSAVQEQLYKCWRRSRSKDLIESRGHFCQLVREVLSFDVRSLHQRQTYHQGAQPATPYRLQLAGVELEYQLLSEQAVLSCARCVICWE